MFITKQDEIFLKEWENGTLLFENWTHISHLRIAFIICLQHYDNKEKIDERIKCGIKKFNKLHEEKLKVGYHETITCFWINVIYSLIIKNFNENFDFDQFLIKEKELTETKLMFEYYSKELLFSQNAKVEFVEPDLK